MKKFIVVILSICIILSSSIFAFAAEQSDRKGNYNPADTSTPINMYNSGFDTLGSLISTVSDCIFVGFVCPSWSNNIGSLTVKLWKWDTNYNTTVAKAPLKEQVFDGYEDNGILGFDLSDAPLAKGYYYIEMSEAVDETGGVGVWSSNKNYPGQIVFRDGLAVDKLSLRMYVNYATEIEGDPYGKLPDVNKEKSPLGGEGTAPAASYILMKDQDLSAIEGNNGGTSVYPAENGNLMVKVLAGTQDSQYSIVFDNHFILDDSIECQKYPYIAMSLKLNPATDMGQGEIFMYTTTIGGATGGYSTAIDYDWTNDGFQRVVIDPTANAKFEANALDGDEWLGFRYDVLGGDPTEDLEVEIEWIAFFENEEAAWNFDGDFSKLATEKPVETPTEKPADPTEKPADPTEKPADPTEKPADSTEKPADATDAPKDEKKSGCGSVITGSIAGLAVSLVALVVLKKKEK